MQTATALTWCAVTAFALADRRVARSLSAFRSASSRPRTLACPQSGADPEVTVIVPARNEGANIGNWIADVVAQTARVVRVVVADDSSEDDTLAVAQRWAQRDRRVLVLRCAPPPLGWTGKNWAAHCAARQAASTWLLFSDADVRMQSDSVEAALRAVDELQGDALSLIAGLECHSVAEKIVMPVMAALILTAYPICFVQDSRCAKGLMWGGFMLVRREAYERVGGHAAIRGEIAEDRAFARLLKAFAYGIRLLNGSSMVHVRMYAGLGSMWEGWRKNIYDGVNRRPLGAVAFIACAWALLVLPMPLAAALAAVAVRRPLSTTERRLMLLAAVGVAGVCGVRLLRDPLSGADFRSVIATPLAGIFVCAVMAASAFRAISGAGQVWKGRTIR